MHSYSPGCYPVKEDEQKIEVDNDDTLHLDLLKSLDDDPVRKAIVDMELDTMRDLNLKLGL